MYSALYSETRARSLIAFNTLCTLFIGDLEVNRLLNEIDDAAKLLPYLWEKDKTEFAVQDIEQAVKPFKVENAQLRRFVCDLHF